jgi:nucleoside-diphosphate-sugar epimerase
MAEITILGGAGFVGRRLSQAIGDHADLYLPAKGDPRLVECDLGTVYYCAGLTADYAARPFDTIEAHTSLIAALAERGRFSRLVYLSSTRLYDTSVEPRMDEDAALLMRPSHPRQIYDLSKALGENLTLTQMDGRGSVARLSNVFDWAEGAPGFLSEWLKAAAHTRNLRLESSPHVARDYIHVDDVASALMVIAASDGVGIVNVASGELVDNAAIAAVFEEAGYSVSFTGDAHPPPSAVADIGRLRGLGVTPRRVREVIAAHLAASGGE